MVCIMIITVYHSLSHLSSFPKSLCYHHKKHSLTHLSGVAGQPFEITCMWTWLSIKEKKTWSHWIHPCGCVEIPKHRRCDNKKHWSTILLECWHRHLACYLHLVIYADMRHRFKYILIMLIPGIWYDNNLWNVPSKHLSKLILILWLWL